MKFCLKMLGMAASAVLLMSAILLSAQESAKPAAIPYTQNEHNAAPRAELFLGYSYLRAMPMYAEGNRMASLNGGSTSIAFNFNRYLGIVGDFGGFSDTQLRLIGTGGSASTTADSSGSAYTYLFGPRVSFRNFGRVTPFAQVLFGGIHASDVTLLGCADGSCTFLPAENSFAWTAGGGVDLRVSRHFAIRLVQAEYLMTNFEDHNTNKNASQNDMRLSTGIVFHFGHTGGPVLPPSPLNYSCSAQPSAVFPGDAVTATGTAVNLNPAKTESYTWTVSGGTVSSVTSTAAIDTANLAFGTYTINGHVSEGDHPLENADCTTTFLVKRFAPPTISCSADPSSVFAGGSSTIMCIGISPQNRPLTYSYSTTDGTVSGTGTTAVLSTIGAPIGTVTVTGNVLDDKGQSASSTTTVLVEAVAAAPTPMTSELCSMNFAQDVRRPSRVSNEAKACLDGIALNLQRNSDAKLAIVGNASNKEKRGEELAAERAIHTKNYLVGEKGIDASRISIFTGTQDAKTVSATLIPAGATFDSTNDTPVDEGVNESRSAPSVAYGSK